jgi:hypothetical protein
MIKISKQSYTLTCNTLRLVQTKAAKIFCINFGSIDLSVLGVD